MPHFYAKFNEEIIQRLLDVIAARRGATFTLRSIAKKTGLQPSHLSNYMHHLVKCGAVEEFSWTTRKGTNYRKKIIYMRKFDYDDINDLMERMG